MRNGSLALADYPGDVVHITCERCGRARKTNLAAGDTTVGSRPAPANLR